MGQSIGRLIFGTQFNSGNKPDRMLEYKPSLPKESKEAIKKPSDDIKIIQKNQKITEKMETFITDTIILAKLRHDKDSNKMVSVIRQKLTEYNGGNWNIIFYKAGSKLKASVINIAFLEAIYDGFKFIVFQNKISMRGIWPTKLGNEGFFDKTESAKNFQQDELGVKIVSKYFGMFAYKTSFFIDAIILEKLRQPDLGKMADSISKKAQEQYGGDWNVIIYDAKCAFDLKFQVETAKGSYIKADYDGLMFYIFPNRLPK